jgi:hypothetical protein
MDSGYGRIGFFCICLNKFETPFTGFGHTDDSYIDKLHILLAGCNLLGKEHERNAVSLYSGYVMCARFPLKIDAGAIFIFR